jgi:hypothetical protein
MICYHMVVGNNSSENNTKKKLDPSTLNFNKKENPDSQKMHYNRFRVNLHVRNDYNNLLRMVIPRGISLKIYGSDVHKNHLAEGCLLTAYCNNINPNELCRREYDELMNFVNTKLSVIRDNPYELKGLEKNANTKIITEVDNEEKANLTFNLVKDEKTGKVFGQM